MPTFDADTWRLVAGITSLLVLASLIGHLLKIALARGEAHPVIDNLNQRINAWWAIATAVGLALLGGRSGVTLLFAIASLVALREFVATDKQCPRPLWWGSFLFLLPLQYLLVWNGSHLLYTALIPFFAWVILPLLGLRSGNLGDFLSRTRSVRSGLLICVFAISHIPALLTLRLGSDPGRNAYLLVFLLLVVQASDVLQYLWGKLAGRHPIAPRLSPSKTVEGSIGGIASACALGAGLSWLTPFTIAEATLVSLMLTLLGFVGGLAMSAFKRRRGIKDWSGLIPGHGGMLDRLDSLFLPSPVFYYLLRCGWGN